MKIDLVDTLSVLNLTLSEILIGEEVAKTRLIQALKNNRTLTTEMFPEHLQDKWLVIENEIYQKPLSNRINKTCSKIIYDLHCLRLDLEKHIKNLEE